MASPLSTLFNHLEDYKRKYYLNLLLKGIIFSAAVLLSAYLLFNTVEYFGRLGTTVRGVLFFSFVAVLLLTLVFWILKPAFFLYGRRKPLSNEEAARQIGRFFPEVGDKLLNTLQLAGLSSNQNELLLASIQQKSQQLGFVRFADAVNLQDNRRYLKFALAPALVILGILFISPKFFTASSTRIVNFQNEYAEEAPFTFLLENKALQAFKNEDFPVSLTLRGGAVPDAVYLLHNERKFRMESTDGQHFTYTFRKIQKAFEFQFEAAGFKSTTYDVDLVTRPSLAAFEVTLNYPAYLNKPNEQLKNAGNLTIPEGTLIRWQFDARDADSVLVKFENEKAATLARKSLVAGDFELEKRAKSSTGYQLFLRNQYASNREGITYFMNVLPDKYPSITLEQYRDSTLYNLLVLGGNIADDYGLSQLRIQYKVVRQGTPPPPMYASFALPVNRSQSIQSFFHQWQTDSLRLGPGDKLEFFVQVWDNDGVNGAKSSRTPIQSYAVPSKQAVEEELENAAEKTESQMDKTLSQAQQLQKELAALENRLRNKRDLDFQDKRQIEELLKKREQLMNEIRAMQEQNKSLNERQQRFNEQNPEMSQKMEQLQKLMDQLLDQDSEKMYNEMKNMLEKNQDERMLEMLDRLKNKEKNTEKELDRALALFKKLQMEQKLDKNIEELKKLAEKQDQLGDKTEKTNPKDEEKKSEAKPKDSKQTEEKKSDAKQPNEQKSDDKSSENDKPNEDKQGKEEKKTGPNEELKKEQEQLQKEMEDIKKELSELEEMSKSDEAQDPMDTDKEQQEDISEQQEQSKKDLQKKENKKSSKAQKSAAKKMKDLAEKLSDMKSEMEMEETQENMADLRDILENLVTLSFDQERVMKEFRNVNLADPRFVKLSQEQLKLQDDAKVVEDSLYALAKRVLQIESFVTRELTDMKRNMDDGVRFIRERRLPQATSKQQFAMSSINNLALMLSDVLKQMQENMASMMMSASGKKGKPKKGNTPSPGVGKKQDQLNQQMQQLKESGKGGRGMSEELARMAAEQSQIRKMLKELMDAQKGTETGRKLSNEVNELLKKMDETEEDLVNKRLNQNTLNRQKDIQVRLLESEKALREQEEDEKRKAETARQVPRRVPPQFEQYVKQKQSQTELLRTVPPALSPFYKREVDTYFKKLR